MSDVIRLNLGSGDTNIPGYTSIDRKLGTEVYPLAGYADGAVDEIRASHVLEHFSYREAPAVLQHWVEKLKPGGVIRIAVPDLAVLAKQYFDGVPLNVQGYIMGGQIDEDDYHRSLYDGECLAEAMAIAGLERIGPWKSDLDDSASLPISVNLMGYKPSCKEQTARNTTAVLSAPRFGPILHFRCALDAFRLANVPYVTAQGAFWHQLLCNMMDRQIRAGAEFIITADYDSVFTRADVMELYRLMRVFDYADAICALQSRRGLANLALFTITDKDGNLRPKIALAEFARNLMPINSGHFGLTILRARALKELPKPWMVGQPAPDGTWGDGHYDPDMAFWQDWKAADKTLFLAPRVVIGHLQEVISWPTKQLTPHHQSVSEYLEEGLPKEVMRC